METGTREPVVLFDGVCNVCNASVNFILDHESDHALRFAAIQSDVGQALLREHGLPTDQVSTIVLVENGTAWTRSDAVLRIARHLSTPWRWGFAARVVPRMVRDAAYEVVAHNRFRIGGQLDQCRVPTPELRARFL